MGVLLLFSLTISLVLFGGRLPSALQDDGWLCNVGGVEEANSGPCSSFIGDAEYKYSTTGEKFEVDWGGVGFWIAFTAAIPIIFALALAFPKFRTEPLQIFGFKDERVEISS